MIGQKHRSCKGKENQEAIASLRSGDTRRGGRILPPIPKNLASSYSTTKTEYTKPK